MTLRTVFPFRRLLTPAGFTYAPVVTVELSHRTVRFLADMVLDSGSEITLLPFRVGHALGLRPAPRGPLPELSGISGRVPYVTRRVGVRMGPFDLTIRAAWSLDDSVPLLLGRQDVFERLRICFDQPHGRIEIVGSRR